MSTRTLSAYFDDVRKGKQDVARVRQFLLDVYDREPVKRGHLLHWLDQAQYEHPIPVTDFLILRKEVEAAVKNSTNRPAADEATVMASAIASPAEPDAATLVATAVTTTATEATESTLMGEEATRIDHSRDMTPLPERSDHAGLHNAATTLRPPAADTLILSSTPVSLPGKSRSVSRRFLLWSALALAGIAVLGMLTLWTWFGQQPPPSGNARISVNEVNQVLNHAPAASIGVPAEAESNDIAPIEPVVETITPLDLNALTEQALLTELQRRVDAGQLLPLDAEEGAHAVLGELSRRFPDKPYLQARISLKNAHLKRSDSARERGEWELAQQHLDAAFDVLQQAAN